MDRSLCRVVAMSGNLTVPGKQPYAAYTSSQPSFSTNEPIDPRGGATCDIACDAPCLGHRQHLRVVGSSLRLASIAVSERLPGRVLHDEAAGDLFSKPGRREAARHLASSCGHASARRPQRPRWPRLGRTATPLE